MTPSKIISTFTNEVEDKIEDAVIRACDCGGDFNIEVSFHPRTGEWSVGERSNGTWENDEWIVVAQCENWSLTDIEGITRDEKGRYRDADEGGDVMSLAARRTAIMNCASSWVFDECQYQHDIETAAREIEAFIKEHHDEYDKDVEEQAKPAGQAEPAEMVEEVGAV